jgi:hypothetical protein
MHERTGLQQRRGEAVTLWRLARADQGLHCFLVEPPVGFWLGLECGPDLIFSETYPDLDAAMIRADGLKAPLMLAGWRELEEP